MLAQLSKRPLASLDTPVHQLLRVALFELRYGKAPARAVVHQAVEQARAQGSKRAAGFVNALLRNQHTVGTVPPRVALNHPDWLLERWEQRIGSEAAHRWARNNNQPAPLCIAVNGDQPDLHSAFQAAGHELEPATAAGATVPGLWMLRGPTGPVFQLPGADEGRWWVQDAGAAAVSDLVGCVPGWRVLDACAAPGGKTFRLAAAGAQVLATDRSATRLDTLRQGIERLGLTADVRQHDWLAGSIQDLPPMDAVLVDAPCSGLGTIRRHPEIRWRRSLAHVLRNADRQLSILSAASHHVRPGGVLVYAVCSGEPEEGEQVATSFVRANPAFELDRCWCSAPPFGDEDAFWAARLLRG